MQNLTPVRRWQLIVQVYLALAATCRHRSNISEVTGHSRLCTGSIF